MAGRNSSKRNQRSRNATARRRRVLGAGTTAGAFLAFGMTPLAAAPAAHADAVDVIIDPIINSLAGPDPTLGADVSGLVTAFDPTFVGDPVAALGSSADSLAAAVPAANPTLADLFQTDFWLPLHTQLQAWIDSPLGMSIDNAINPFFATGGFCGLICNGTDGTMAAPDGGNGGLWFGDGGTGWTSTEAGVAGGERGDAGGWGNGGFGGDGGLSADGGAGGNGGEGFGNGGLGG